MINAKLASSMTVFAKLSQIDSVIRKAAGSGENEVTVHIDRDKIDCKKLIKCIQKLGFSVNMTQELKPGISTVTDRITISWN